jgi:DNA-binding GntR family transcriptional regulator
MFKKPTTLRGQVEDYLRTLIMEGQLMGGERLRENELCEKLNISRPTLREALRTLEAERLISIEPHRGPSVVRISEKAARDLYALRALLEGFAAHEFARLADDASIERLRQKVRKLHKQTERDKIGLLAAKREFYDVLLDGCGNELMKDILPGLLSRINLLRATSFSRRQRLTESLAEIDTLFERIAARDPIGAQQAAQLHIRNASDAALVVLKQQEAASEPPAADGSDGAAPRHRARQSPSRTSPPVR